MQLIIKKAGYWESLTVFLQDGRIPNIANHGIPLELEPAIWFKVQLLESLSADCDTEIITWTMNSVDDQQGRLQAVSLESSLTRSLMATQEDADMQKVFSKIEDFLALRKSTGTMTHSMSKHCAHWLHHLLLPRVTLLPCDLPLVKDELQKQNNVLKVIDEALLNESTSIHELREQLQELRETILAEIKDWVAKGIYSYEFIDFFLQDIKRIESEARNKFGNVTKQLELKNCSTATMERLQKDKATSVTEFTKLLNVRCEIDKLCSNVEPKTTNELQTQYLNISEGISLHRKARSSLNKDRILAVSVREALLSTSKRLTEGHITTGIDQGIHGGMAFDVLPKKHVGMVISVNDALKTLLQDSTSEVYAKHKAFLHTIETLLGNYGTILMTRQHLNGVSQSQQRLQLNMEFIGACIQEHFQEMIEQMHKHCNIGTTSIESFRQQVWLSYESCFFENYSKKLLKLYQIEKQDHCEKLMLETSKIDIEYLSIPSEATWLINFVSQLLSDNCDDNRFVPSSVDGETATLLNSFLHDIKCLEYSHTPLAKMQLLTSAFRKSGTILSSVKAKLSHSITVSCDDFIPFLVVCLVKMPVDLRCLIFINCCFLMDVIPPFLTMGWHGYSHTSFQAACNVAAKLLSHSSS